MQQHSIHSLTERCKWTLYPVIKLGLDEHGPFRRMNLGQENADLLYDLNCRAIEMYSDQQTTLIEYSLYMVILKYKDKDGEECVIISGDELVDAINEYKGSASFKVIAHVKEKGKEPIGSIIGIMCQDNNNSVERREDSGDRASINSSESRDGRGDLSALTEPPKLSLKIPAASSRRKSLFGFFKRKRIGAGAVAGDSSLKTDEASIISSTVLHGQDGTGKDIVALSSSTPRIVHFNDDYGGIGASSNLPCLSGDEHELWTITRIVK